MTSPPGPPPRDRRYAAAIEALHEEAHRIKNGNLNVWTKAERSASALADDSPDLDTAIAALQTTLVNKLAGRARAGREGGWRGPSGTYRRSPRGASGRHSGPHEQRPARLLRRRRIRRRSRSSAAALIAAV